MKNLMLTFIMAIGFAFSMNAQVHLNKNGTPDMRYKENKQMYGGYNNNTYSTPNYNTPKYTQPSYNQYPSNKNGTPDMRYNNNNMKNYNPYPTNKNGTPDMRYKSNQQIYRGY